MNELSIDALSRRASLMTIGMAGLAGLAGPISAGAKNKKNKKRNKNKSKNQNKKCKNQVGACQEGIADLCEVSFGVDDVEECLAHFGPCCEPLTGCNVAEAFACAVEVVKELEP